VFDSRPINSKLLGLGRIVSLELREGSLQAGYAVASLTVQIPSRPALLARATSPEAVPVRARDHGLDARLADTRGGTLRGWQAKRYTVAINWEECRQSVRRALAFWRPPRITFCFPRDLSGGEQERFRTELIERFPEVRLDFWPGGELQRLIRDTDEGQRAVAWLFANPGADREAMLRALATGGVLESTRHAVERQAVIQEFMDRDPHLHYTMVSRSPGGRSRRPLIQRSCRSRSTSTVRRSASTPPLGTAERSSTLGPYRSWHSRTITLAVRPCRRFSDSRERADAPPSALASAR